MRMRYGATRFVLLAGDKAYKFGRVRPFRFLARMCILPFSQKRRKHFFERYGPGFGEAMKNDLFAGLRANQNEDTYYRTFRDSRVMPITGVLLGGWVIIQMRGTPVSREELEKSPFTAKRLRRRDCDLSGNHQFCRFDGKVVLVDYGGKVTTDALIATRAS